MSQPWVCYRCGLNMWLSRRYWPKDSWLTYKIHSSCSKTFTWLHKTHTVWLWHWLVTTWGTLKSSKSSKLCISRTVCVPTKVTFPAKTSKRLLISVRCPSHNARQCQYLHHSLYGSVNWRTCVSMIQLYLLSLELLKMQWQAKLSKVYVKQHMTTLCCI